jgi:cobalt-zinc-cadmium efflux system protein
MGTTEVALTAHVIVRWPAEPPPFLDVLERELRARFGIHHATVQLEALKDGAACALASADVV